MDSHVTFVTLTSVPCHVILSLLRHFHVITASLDLVGTQPASNVRYDNSYVTHVTLFNVTHVTLFTHPYHLLPCHCCVTRFCCHIARQPCWFLQSYSHPADTGVRRSHGRLFCQNFVYFVFVCFFRC